MAQFSEHAREPARLLNVASQENERQRMFNHLGDNFARPPDAPIGSRSTKVRSRSSRLESSVKVNSAVAHSMHNLRRCEGQLLTTRPCQSNIRPGSEITVRARERR